MADHGGALMEFTHPVHLMRDWGEETIVVLTPIHAGKILTMRAGTKGGVQFHAKEEAHYIVSGIMRIRWDAGDGQLRERTVQAGEGWRVPPFAVHQEEAVSDCTIFEVGDPTINDRVRVEADYGLPTEGGLPSMTPSEAVTKLRTFAAALRERADECEYRAGLVESNGLR